MVVESGQGGKGMMDSWGRSIRDLVCWVDLSGQLVFTYQQ